MKLALVSVVIGLSLVTASAVFLRENPNVPTELMTKTKEGVAETPAWMDPTDPRCGAIEPWSKHKPFEPIVGKTKEAKESQCHACKVRACNAGLPPPGEVGGCRCISYKDGGGNYATDCKNLLNKNLPVDYEKCGEVRDCDALEGQCVSAKFKMDSAKEAPWMKSDWKGAKASDTKTPAWMDPANPRCGAIEPWSKHKPFKPTVGKTQEAKESQCHACKVRACNAGLPPPGEVGGCRCISYKDSAGNYATDCKNLLNKNLPIDYEKCGEVRDCDALEGQCVSAEFKMDSAKEAPWMKDDWKGAKGLSARTAGLALVSIFGLMGLLEQI